MPTADRIIIDGANSVCGETRSTSTRPAASDLLVFAGVTVLAIAALGFRRLSRATGALVAVAVLATFAGWWSLLVRRGDAPRVRPDLARHVALFYEELDAFARTWHGCVGQGRGDCEACQPVLRLVQPVHHRCLVQGRLELGAGAPSTGCTQHGAELDCGSRMR